MKKAIKNNFDNKAFSLIELVIVIAILSILSAIAIPSFPSIIRYAEKVIATLVIKNVKRDCQYGEGEKYGEFNKTFLLGYTFSPSNSNNCSNQELISLNTEHPTINPSFHYKNKTGEITCTFGSNGFVDFTSTFPSCDKPKEHLSEEEFTKKFLTLKESGLLLEDMIYTRDDSRYVVVKGSTWEEAQKNANLLGGHLASITTRDENDFLVNKLYGVDKVSDKLVGPGNNSLWLGLNDRKSEGNWENVSGVKNVYNNFAPGEPDGSSGYKSDEQYANFNLLKTYNREPGMWSDVPNGGNPNLKGDKGVRYGLAEIKVK